MIRRARAQHAWARTLRSVARATDDRPARPLNCAEPSGAVWRLSAWGKALCTILLSPAAASIVAFLAMPHAIGGFGLSDVAFLAGLLAGLTAYPFTLMHARWHPALRADPDNATWADESRPDGRPAVVVVAGVLAAASAVVEAGLWVVLVSRSVIALAPVVVLAAVAVTHLWLTATRTRDTEVAGCARAADRNRDW